MGRESVGHLAHLFLLLVHPPPTSRGGRSPCRCVQGLEAVVLLLRQAQNLPVHVVVVLAQADRRLPHLEGHVGHPERSAGVEVRAHLRRGDGDKEAPLLLSCGSSKTWSSCIRYPAGMPSLWRRWNSAMDSCSDVQAAMMSSTSSWWARRAIRPAKPCRRGSPESRSKARRQTRPAASGYTRYTAMGHAPFVVVRM